MATERFDASAHHEGMKRVVNDCQGDDVDGDREGDRFNHGPSLTYLRQVDIKA